MPHPFDWTVLRSRHIVQDRWISLRADTCGLPDAGVVEPYYVLEYSAWVNVVALTADEEVVLVRLYRHGIQETVLELPSGTVENSETPLKAVQRELLEETGYGGGTWVETGQLSPNPANHTNRVHCFLATGVEPVADPLMQETECVQTVLLPLVQVVKLARSNQFFQALHIGSLFFALDQLGRLVFK